MKHLHDIPATTDPQVMVPVFKTNKEEARLIRDVMKQFYLSIPKGVFELSPARRRALNIVKALDFYLQPQGNEKDPNRRTKAKRERV